MDMEGTKPFSVSGSLHSDSYRSSIGNSSLLSDFPFFISPVLDTISRSN